MTDITERLSRYLLARLRRAAVHDIYEHAAGAGLLESAFIDKREQTGLVWRLDPGSRFVSTGDVEADHMQIARLLRRAPVPSRALGEDGDLDADGVTEMIPTVSRLKGEPVDALADQAAVGRNALLRLLRTLALPPSPADAAVVLSLARAVGQSVDSLEQLHALLRRRDPMMIVSVPLKGFERRLGSLLARGWIMPRVPPQVDGLGNYALSGRYNADVDDKPRLVTFSGETIMKSADDVA
ncbi:MAG: hypothetical protein KL863_28645 [Rhizobium sp.]|nr:hypothetical protein [Rhizobium sp.]